MVRLGRFLMLFFFFIKLGGYKFIKYNPIRFEFT